MSPLVPLTLFAWLPLVVLLFALLPARQAFVVSYLGAWMFLPMAYYALPGLPDYTKMTATGFGVLAATLIFHTDKLTRFRPSWFDLPMVIWLLVPVATFASNGLKLYDGMSAALFQTFIWGVHYFLTRLYFDDLDGLKMICVGLIAGGLIYIPLCLLEMRMSPQLHRWIYGFHQHIFIQAKREGGWRPTVFMQHGLAVATFMSLAALTSFWFWMRKTVRQVMGIPIGYVCAMLVTTVILCRSEGATILLLIGIAAMGLIRSPFGRVGFLVLAMIPPMYMAIRGTSAWDGYDLVSYAETISGTERAKSLRTRIYSENLLSDKARQKPMFGWGGFGRYLVPDAIPDGMWVLALGKYGVVGLSAFTIMCLAPPLALMRRYRLADWRREWLSPAVVVAMALVLHMIDNLMNAMVNPLYMMFCGGLAGFLSRRVVERRKYPMPARAPVAGEPPGLGYRALPRR